MMDLTASVVIVSRHRPAHLKRCLKALEFQLYSNFEVVIVCDSQSSKAVECTNARWVSFDEANISAARNLGISHASGSIVAFIDDDAIPEPTWLLHLLEPFSDDTVSAAGGYVRGRNGISFQWKAEILDGQGQGTPIEIDDMAIIRGTNGYCVKTQGTNCAFRREILIGMGGFDENFRYFMDETELNIRLGIAGRSVAVVPNAEVQHGFAENATRATNRAPKSLFEIGGSIAYFAKKYELGSQYILDTEQAQRRRLISFLDKGYLEPRDIDRLMATFQDGLVNGEAREETDSPELADLGSYRPYHTNRVELPCSFIVGRRINLRRLHQDAKQRSSQGIPTTLILLSPTTWRHKRYFHDDGYWVQTGGLFGKSLRTDPPVQLTRYKTRFQREIGYLLRTRPLK